MYRVRIKTSPNGGTTKATGQQEEFGLVRNLAAMQNAPQTTTVNNKMGAIPRDQANIEVEGGESVIGDVNQDGTMELMHFVGKRHSEGGVPVNIPEGSFIYSDTKSLIIKDREVIEKLFNLPFRKQGYTPAEISKKYEINTYVEVLKDENADPLAKRSAAEMLKKNKQKLGILAFIQESMKGFPDGIPAIAEEVLATMGIDPNQMAQQFAPQQPQQGGMPPMGEQGIPMSEDEDAMSGMMPEGPAVAPDDLANQMSAKFGGTKLPTYAVAGTVSGCPKGYVWNSKAGQCVLPQYANSDVWRIPGDAFAINMPKWEEAPAPAPKKKMSAADQKAQTLFENNFKIIDKGPTAYEKAKAAQIKAIEEQRKKSGYYDKAKELQPLVKKVMSGTATAEEEKRAKELNEALLGIKADGTYTEDRKAEEKAIYDIDKKYGTLSEQQKEKQKREDDAAKAKAEAEARAKNPYKDNIPGFGTKSDLDDFMSSGSTEFAVGDTFYKALLSGDPYAMIAAADDIKDVDVPYSVGWLPWTNQDKIDDMYTILHEEAYKTLNKKEKEKLQTQYKVADLNNKLDELIAKAEKDAANAVSIADKQRLAADALKFKRYKEYLESERHKDWRKESIDNSFIAIGKDPDNVSRWWSPYYAIGNPIQDRTVSDSDTETFFINHGDDIAEETDSWFSSPRHKTYLEVYDEITKAHDKLKGTSVSVVAPIGTKGLTFTRGARGMLGLDAPNIEDNVRAIANASKATNAPKDAKTYKPEYKISALPNSVFRVDTDANGNAVWTEYTSDGAEMAVSNPEIVKELNQKASITEKKPFAIKPAADVGTGSIIDILNQENKINPQSTTPVQQPANNQGTTQTPRKSVVAPVKPTQEKAKFTNGLSDDDFNFEKGGVVGETMTINGQTFRYGGLINEEGKLKYNRGGSVLPKYETAGTVGGDPPSEVPAATPSGKLKGTEVLYFVQTIPDPNGGQPTVINIIRKKSDNSIVGRKNMTTGEAINDPTQVISRASTEWITPDNLNDWEKKHIAERWNGNAQAYADYQNANNQIRLNTDFRKAIVDQYKQDVKDAEKRMYTGKKQGTRNTFHGYYGADVEALADNPEKIIETMMNFERNNARLAAYGFDAEKSDQNVAGGTDVGKYVNKQARDLINNTPGLQDLDFSKNYLGQGTYISYRRALMNDPKFQDLAEHKQTGVSDETTFGITGKVSGIDNYNTNTTLGERLGYKTKPPGPPPPKPGKKQAFYCVEYSDGTKNVQTVDYDEGASPTAPTGDKVVKATLYDTLELANKNCEVPKTPPEITPPPKQPQPGPWWTPDVINLATGIRQRVPHPNAVLRQMPQIYSGYDLNNPITQIAGATGLMRQQQDLAMNTMDPTTAFAATAGQGYDALAKGISDVEFKNVDTVNNYLGRIGQLQYNYDAANMQGRRQFDVDTEVGKEEFARDLNKVDAQNALLYNTGWGNVLKDEGFKLAYPQAYHANRITPYYAWSGIGKDPLAPDTSYTPVSGVTGQTDCSGVYTQAYNQVKNDATMDDAAKKDYASKMQASCIAQNTSRANSQSKTQQQSYVANANALFSSEFGGTFYTAPGSYEFGGTYFDDF